MRRLRTVAAYLVSTMLVCAPGAAPARPPAASTGADIVTGATLDSPRSSEKEATFVPADFNAPISAEGAGFKLVPLGPDLVDVDFAAYMSSIEHLQKTFTRSTDWPHAGINRADALKDMETEQARFRNRKSFAYAVLTPDGRRERGSVYVSPSPVPGYDAVVRMWVTKAEYDAGFDLRLYKWIEGWMKKAWPFSKIAYPGRSINVRVWERMAALHRSNKVSP